ncbi:MAG: lysylphosphatidylglycerol synthase domain-containing protein, partial [Candidatus Nanopelagicales bacterium]
MSQSRPSYLIATADQPRARRARDVTMVVVGLLLVSWSLLVFKLSDPFQDALTKFAQALPDWAVALLAFGYTLGLIYSIVVIVVLLWNRRWAGLRDVVLATVISSVVTLVLVDLFGDLWPTFISEFMSGPIRSQFPVLRVASITAILVASTPFLARPIRRLGWFIVFIVSAAAVVLAISVPSGAVAAVGVGLVSAGAVLLGFGSPLGYPDTKTVRDALARIGLPSDDLAIAHDQSWGVRRLVGRLRGGEAIEVKAYGRDATDSQVIAKLWRTLLYRGGAGRITLSRVQSVEHEALVTMLATKAGVTTPEVWAAAAASDEVAVLVTTQVGTPLALVHDLAEVGPQALSELWREVALMHNSGITHGNLDARAVRINDGAFVISDFADGSVVFRDADAALDITHLLFATAGAFGSEVAVAAALDGIGAEKLSASLAYLQRPAFSKHEWNSVEDPGQVLKDIRAQVAEVTESEVPEPIKLRRVSIKDILTIVLVLLFLSALVPLLTGVDFPQVWASLSGATWWLAFLALLAGQVAFIPMGTSMMFAVGRAIPLRPMTILQPSCAFMNFAVPGMAGRIAMESAFLYKYGIAPAVSVTKGAVDTFGGFLAQLAILIVALLSGSLILDTSASSASGSGGRSVSWAVVAVVVLLAVATIIAIIKVPKLHDRVVPVVKSSWGALAEVLKSPKIALGMLGSQFLVQVLWGMALWLALRSLDFQLSLISCTGVVVATALLQGLIPVPGGIGVAEAVMTAFLVPLGVPAEVAMGATIIWRVATFYLPATQGFFTSKY